ncbi:unnamed protein product (macronuclear) [Paramecium tetraurelia]|uniref:RING-type domain-containing protein n=1 Tax=Paramecium tetraurelia TaxID=5888 RepID=A0E469_PARTE|nr:uncharacterized protein GSPATT00023260001 [Paramecium tetraurelia]CAK90086.1 unnamed protein product [Paramecium tetraurelia]|eukprot:XP_001457483.1 hypothetical protein (macronuclear) [Paramecium tetraurelia strain d4-2]
MLEIRDVAKQITSKLTQKFTLVDQSQLNLVLDSFVLGFLQGGSLEKNIFQQHLDILVSLKAFKDCEIINQQRLYKLYSDSLKETKNVMLKYQIQLLIFYKEVQNEIFEKLENNQNVIFESQWEIIQKPSAKPLNNVQQQTVFAIYQKFRQENEDQQKSLEYTIEQIQDNYRLKMEQQKLENQLNYQEIECKICLQNIPFIEMVLLHCSHYFHQSCLKLHCITQLQQKSIPIQCPSGCKKIIILRDIETVLDKPELQEFQILSLRAYFSSKKEYSCCPTADCAYFFIPDDNPHFDCPVCNKSYCLECKIEYHNGFSCQEYRDKQMTQSNEVKFQSFVKEANYKQCPKCKVWIEKSQGCAHMKCKCNFQFCYNCGGEYKKCKCKNNTIFSAIINIFSGNS